MDASRAHHAGYFASLIANHVMIELYSAKAVYWLDWLEREHDNVRATLTWTVAEPHRAELMATLVFALTWFWYRRGYFSEGRRWAERALDSPALTTAGPAYALAHVSNGLLAIWQGEQQIGLSHLQEGLEIWKLLEDKQWLAPAFLSNGIALINMGRDSDALPFLEKARAMLEGANQPFFHVFTLVHLGNAELGLGNPDQARAWLEKAQAEASAIGDSWLLSFVLNNLGEVARTLGQYDRARTYYEQSESLLRSIDDKGDLARLIHTLGYIAQYEEDFELAEAQFRKSLTMFRRLGNRRGIAECLAGLAGLKARQGQTQWGTIMLSAAESILKITGGAWWPADRVEVERNREMLRAALPADEFEKATKTGEAMNMDQAIAFASEA
jgi:tetratricopeptide (TPR) repeat protein